MAEFKPASFGARFGQSIGQGLESGLKALTARKLRQLQANEDAEATKGFYGSREAAEAAARHKEVRSGLGAGYPIRQLQEENRNLAQEANGIRSLLQSNQSQLGLETLGSQGNEEGFQQLLKNSNVQGNNGPAGIEQLMRAIQGNGIQQQPQAQSTPEQQQVNPAARRLQEIEQRQQQIKESLNPEKKITPYEQEKLRQGEEKINNKETKEYGDRVLKQENAAKDNDIRLLKISNAVKKGNLPNPKLWAFLTKIEDESVPGLAAAGAAIGGGVGSLAGPLAVPAALAGGVIGALVSPFAGLIKNFIRSGDADIEEVEKLSADFVKNIKDTFGARVTDLDLRSYMQTIPNLMQTDAGKERVIENLRLFNGLAKKEAEAFRDIVKKNNGKRPFDIEQQVQERLNPYYDEIIKGIESTIEFGNKKS